MFAVLKVLLSLLEEVFVLNKVKRLLKKIGGGGIQNLVVKFLIWSGMNNKYILFTKKKAKKNSVNINYCHDFLNVGDNISPVIVNYVAESYGINMEQHINETRHLYAIGSIITAGAQDCTIWGSGLLNTKILGRLASRKLDIRSVRGPLTRIVLMDQGYDVPEVFGDPAILMPLIYNPDVEKKYPVSVITHTNEGTELPDWDVHVIDVQTDDYKEFVEEIKASELVISSSLHGIIFAEVYGVKAILLKPREDLFKYFDYYFSTNRFSFPIADTVEKALKMTPVEIPDFTEMQDGIMKAFPDDLWLSK